MAIKHYKHADIWLVSKGERVLYRGRENPFKSASVLMSVLYRSGWRVVSI